ncbi:SMODS domain-containing nucleotidyltransferase [Caulobacter segnis]
MWIAVTERFRRLNEALVATDRQVGDARTKLAGLIRCLNAAYYNLASDVDHGRLVGSWAKQTQIVHTEDVDLLFQLPFETYLQFAAYVGNGQSALLQQVKGVIENRYPNTTMRGDGQVVVVAFNSLTVEVIPGFSAAGGQFQICDTHNGGSFKTTDPVAQEVALNTSDLLKNGNARQLVRMIKAWKYVCNVPIKSFQIEILVPEYLNQVAWGEYSFFYYDWLVRDFFAFLLGRANGLIWVPGTHELNYLGSAWEPAARRAYGAASAACVHERDDRVAEAGDEWQKIFGESIQRA